MAVGSRYLQENPACFVERTACVQQETFDVGQKCLKPVLFHFEYVGRQNTAAEKNSDEDGWDSFCKKMKTLIYSKEFIIDF